MIPKMLRVNSSIVLKELSINDAPVIFDSINNNRKHLTKWLPFVDNTKELDDTLAFVKSIVNDRERRQEIFTIWNNQKFAGLIGLKDFDYLNRKVEIGYWLIESMTGKGIITQSVEEIMRFIFEKVQLNRIQIKCGVGNSASSAVPKRLGFIYEGIERQGERHIDKYIDLEVYSYLRRDWN